MKWLKSQIKKMSLQYARFIKMKRKNKNKSEIALQDKMREQKLSFCYLKSAGLYNISENK